MHLTKVITILAATTLLLSGATHASLGEPSSSVASDGRFFHAQQSLQIHTTYTEHDLVLGNGIKIKEFATDGSVFAVNWQGPAQPDLQQLLGRRFSRVQNEVAEQALHHPEDPLRIRQADLVVHSGEDSHHCWGVAYLPQRLPASVQSAVLRQDPHNIEFPFSAFDDLPAFGAQQAYW